MKDEASVKMDKDEEDKNGIQKPQRQDRLKIIKSNENKVKPYNPKSQMQSKIPKLKNASSPNVLNKPKGKPKSVIEAEKKKVSEHSKSSRSSSSGSSGSSGSSSSSGRSSKLVKYINLVKSYLSYKKISFFTLLYIFS